MSKLSQATKHAVAHNFPSLALTYGEEPDPIVTIAPAHPDFGPIEVMDDEFEITVNCGRFTHVHLSNDDEGIDQEERNRRIVAALISFLRDIVADRMEFWGSHRGGGGCRLRGSQGPFSKLIFGPPTFVWSGPIHD